MDIQTLALKVDRMQERQDGMSRSLDNLRRDHQGDIKDLDRRVERLEMKLFWMSLTGSLAGGLVGAGLPALARVLT